MKRSHIVKDQAKIGIGITSVVVQTIDRTVSGPSLCIACHGACHVHGMRVKQA